ncbi:hypothetical protein TNCV_361831 [Trichonephila clavipes]|nr:hypothetical protein TNCV_361831 [Trichonephila clavipes]
MAHQTALARFSSGHLRSMTFVQEGKSFFTCPCSLPASPAHLLDCRGTSLRQLYAAQDLDMITPSPSTSFARANLLYINVSFRSNTRFGSNGLRNVEPLPNDKKDIYVGTLHSKLPT